MAMIETDLSPLSHVADTIRLAVAPVFLLTAIGGFLNVCASRLARVIDRARAVEKLLTSSRGKDHDRYINEIRTLDRRIGIINFSILLSVLSACMICLVVILLFSNQLVGERFDTLIALLFIGSMLCMGAGFALFIVETRIGSAVIRVRNEILHHKPEEE
ncbi:MAG: hypothetical protein B7Z20_06565 [Sphingobium sp. 32-64-5]|nr:MAG: hypothetical protein B7Z20_06565 [Sphingobium sp. 32-64-5]